ncbi:28 kDa ribonucleoprotein, chloroplastic [Elaeis guineensis]|uniref:29 kDa ribonucleoprotein B, chloroplastic n=1 Tax=Elaeis guineensis var. tenera TaxID=51953 RepID=A0A6I9SFR9_ELAGV|nr:29 kDa ribonucleoprotein B, chloroplastic [Elaeis guineensis]XP_010942625.1 29 kDa ribonucleoprotein B, chloroplastic [Elaeis guineensis]XP_029116412.1 29 kDa ribonucleoprotein B, chloroplastic [Elaeis guineensis]
MALLLLRLPSPLQPHVSPPLSKPSQTQTLFPFTVPQIPSTRSSTGGIFFLQRPFSPIAALSTTSSATETAAAEESTEIPGEVRKRLIAQNIPWTCTAEDIRKLFEQHGTVIDVELSMYNRTRNRGLAFVTMASEEEAVAALNNLNSYELDGRVIKVEFARSLKKDSSAATIPVPKFNVFVGNLSWRVRSRDLRELFNASGNVLSAEVIFQSNPRRSAGYGFVSFASKEEAEAAIATYNGKKLMGRPVNLAFGTIQTDSAEAKLSRNEQLDDTSNAANGRREQSNEDGEM